MDSGKVQIDTLMWTQSIFFLFARIVCSVVYHLYQIYSRTIRAPIFRWELRKNPNKYLLIPKYDTNPSKVKPVKTMHDGRQLFVGTARIRQNTNRNSLHAPCINLFMPLLYCYESFCEWNVWIIRAEWWCQTERRRTIFGGFQFISITSRRRPCTFDGRAETNHPVHPLCVVQHYFVVNMKRFY